MNGYFVTIPNQSDISLFKAFTERMGIMITPLSEDEILDMKLLKAMEEGKETKFVSKERIMQKLSKGGS